MSAWYTADLHLRHRLVANIRGFETVDEHDAALAANWDRVVHPEDRVWILGDLTLGNRRNPDFHAALEWVAARPGVKHLVFGNHDSGHPMHADAHRSQAAYMEVFASAQQSGTRKIAGHRVMLSHFPFTADHTDEPRYPQWRPVDIGQWLLHGHTHTANRRTERQIHVGLDAWDLAPVHQSRIEGLITVHGAPVQEWIERGVGV